MINLAQTQHEESVQLAKIRRVVKAVTSAVLVMYIVGAGGVLGWWWYTRTASSRATGELEEMAHSVQAKAEEEAVVRRLMARSLAVQAFLDGRQELGGEAEYLAGRQQAVTQWDYDVSKGVYNLTVRAEGVGAVEQLVADLQGRYSMVKLEAVSWEPTMGWTGRVTYGGGK